jgi:telomerase reverse transcriptase
VLDGSVFLPWCGYLINVKTFEFQLDYLRYVVDNKYGTINCCSVYILTAYFKGVLESLTVERSRHPGEALYNKMAKVIKFRCHPLLLDTNINSMFVVRLNVYQLFLFCAIKFHCHVKAMPQGVPQNPRFFTSK